MESVKNRRGPVRTPLRFLIAMGFLLAVALTVAACQSSSSPAATEAPAAEAPATEAATEAATATAAEEATEEATAAATEEATAAATEEATATATEEATEAPAGTGDAANGQYIANLTGGCGCHFNSDLGALAGGRKFEGPFGTVYAANLTSDPQTGIANVSDENLIRILRTGQADMGNGQTYVVHPIMPYMTFSIMSDKDAADVVAYLRTLEPVANAVPKRELNEEPQPWTPPAAPPAEAPTEPVARGNYLVTLASCGGCHTPKNADGSNNQDLYLAGAPLPGDSGEVASNITPDEATGIGTWTEDQIAHFLLTGIKPDGKEVKGAMAQQIQRRFSKLTQEDVTAMAAYLKSIPAVNNDPTKQ